MYPSGFTSRISPAAAADGESGAMRASSREAAPRPARLNVADSRRASSSTTRNPALCRVPSYLGPGLPRPTITRTAAPEAGLLLCGVLPGAFFVLVDLADDLRLGGLEALFFFLGHTRRHDGHESEIEVVEDLGGRRKLIDDVRDVQALTDLEGAYVQLDMGGDVSRQHGDQDLATLNVELPAVPYPYRVADVLDGHRDLNRLVGTDGVEVYVHRLATPLVHLYLLDDDAMYVTGDVKVDQAGVARRAESLVEGSRLDADRHVDLAVVYDRG